jgi:hypothetical protein
MSNTYGYRNFNASSASNQTVNCTAYSNLAKVAKYSFNDLVTL